MFVITKTHEELLELPYKQIRNQETLFRTLSSNGVNFLKGILRIHTINVITQIQEGNCILTESYQNYALAKAWVIAKLVSNVEPKDAFLQQLTEGVNKKNFADDVISEYDFLQKNYLNQVQYSETSIDHALRILSPWESSLDEIRNLL